MCELCGCGVSLTSGPHTADWPQSVVAHQHFLHTYYTVSSSRALQNEGIYSSDLSFRHPTMLDKAEGKVAFVDADNVLSLLTGAMEICAQTENRDSERLQQRY